MSKPLATTAESSGVALALSLGTWLAVPATVFYGAVLTVPAYSLSHECAHGTAFRSRWLNELVFWVASLIYLEPLSDRAVPRAGQAERGDPRSTAGARPGALPRQL